MFEKKLESVIGIDTDSGEVHFYLSDRKNENSIGYFVANCKSQSLNAEFFRKLSGAMNSFRESHPEASLQKVALVLSDNNVMTDTVNLPIINRKAMDASLDASLNNLYGSGELKYNRQLAMQNKQFATYVVTGIRKDLLVKLQDAFADNQVGVSTVTYAAATTANSAMVLNPKLKNASFVLLDVKETMTRIVFVVKGKTLGFYSLPFGENVLHQGEVVPEDMMFDHPSAELLVLNAKEKAKAKALTAAEDFMALPLVDEDADSSASDEMQQSDEQDDDEDDEVKAEEIVISGKLRKKTPRKLPKYMQRSIPEDAEGIVYENFRVFVKWTLELISSNAAITSLGTPEAVYVNMNDSYSFLYDKVNADKEEHGISFLPLSSEKNPIIKGNLELYGGFFAKQYNGINNFHATQLDSFKTKHDEHRASVDAKSL